MCDCCLFRKHWVKNVSNYFVDTGKSLKNGNKSVDCKTKNGTIDFQEFRVERADKGIFKSIQSEMNKVLEVFVCENPYSALCFSKKKSPSVSRVFVLEKKRNFPGQRN